MTFPHRSHRSLPQIAPVTCHRLLILQQRKLFAPFQLELFVIKELKFAVSSFKRYKTQKYKLRTAPLSRPHSLVMLWTKGRPQAAGRRKGRRWVRLNPFDRARSASIRTSPAKFPPSSSLVAFGPQEAHTVRRPGAGACPGNPFRPQRKRPAGRHQGDGTRVPAGSDRHHPVRRIGGEVLLPDQGNRWRRGAERVQPPLSPSFGPLLRILRLITFCSSPHQRIRAAKRKARRGRSHAAAASSSFVSVWRRNNSQASSTAAPAQSSFRMEGQCPGQRWSRRSREELALADFSVGPLADFSSVIDIRGGGDVDGGGCRLRTIATGTDCQGEQLEVGHNFFKSEPAHG